MVKHFISFLHLRNSSGPQRFAAFDNPLFVPALRILTPGVRANGYARFDRGAWWSLNKGTIRVGVSVEQLQAKIIGVDLARDARAGRVSLDADGGGAGGVTGGVAGAACEEFKGEEASPPVELSCKVGNGFI